MPHVQTGLEVRAGEVSNGGELGGEELGGEELGGEELGRDARSQASWSATNRQRGAKGVARRVRSIIRKVRAPKQLAKYYFQRYRLFERFDEGIALDEQSWYSVTPEKIAKHIAQRFAGREVIVDLYGGAGGNSIQFALQGAYVIAVERDEARIELARHNARIYGVEQFVEFVAGDVEHVLDMLRGGRTVVDGIFMSPPWGGPQYWRGGRYDAGVFREVVAKARAVTDAVAILLPRTVHEQDVARTFGRCELERNFLGGRLKTVTLYFGALMSCGA